MKTIIIIIIIQLFAINAFSQKDSGDEWTHDTVTFEKPCQYLEIGNSANNIWQIGVPQKTFFNSSYSLPNAIVTDTLNNYPINNYSYFDLYIGEFNFPYYYSQMCFEMKHKFDTDTLKDGGYITISYDKGQIWYNIINDITFNYEQSPNPWYGGDTILNNNLYSPNDTLYNGEYGFSGKSDWITSRFSWSYIPVKKNFNKDILDTVILRFNFISDDIDTDKEGWMIDDIRLFNVDLGGSVENINKQHHSVLQTNPVKNKTLIVFDRIYKQVEIEIYNINGQLVKNNVIFNQKQYTFFRKYLNGGIYFVKLRFDNKFSETHKLIISE